MMSYPVLKGTADIDECAYTHLRNEAQTHHLSAVETQQCILAFARRMLHALAQRNAAGEPMTGSGLMQWLKESAQNHLQLFLCNYHAVPFGRTTIHGSADNEVLFGGASKQSEIGVAAPEAVMLSGYDGVLASAACQLNPSARVLVMWHYFGGMSVSEIAKIVGSSEVKITVRILLAVAELQSVLSRQGYALALPRCDYTLEPTTGAS